MTILHTSRLKLVPYRVADIDSLYAIMKDERVMRHIGQGVMSRDEVVALVGRNEKRWRDIGMGMVGCQVEIGRRRARPNLSSALDRNPRN
jgi:hypothetical protein